VTNTECIDKQFDDISNIETFLFAQTPETDPQTEFFYNQEQIQARNAFIDQTIDELFGGRPHGKDYDKNRKNYFDGTVRSTLATVEPLIQEMATRDGFLYLNGGSTPRIQKVDPISRVSLVEHVSGQISNALCKEAHHRTEIYKIKCPSDIGGSVEQEQLMEVLDELFRQNSNDTTPPHASHDRHQLLKSTKIFLLGLGEIRIPVKEFNDDLTKWVYQLIQLQDYVEAKTLQAHKRKYEPAQKSMFSFGRSVMEIFHKKS
jgi:hypothetical protein